jgi:hypothetical protein
VSADAARAALTDARATAAALVATDRLGAELTPALEHGVVPQVDAALADVEDGLLDVAARSVAGLLAAVDSMAGPLGLPPALRPVQEALRRGLAALQP